MHRDICTTALLESPLERQEQKSTVIGSKACCGFRRHGTAVHDVMVDPRPYNVHDGLRIYTEDHFLCQRVADAACTMHVNYAAFVCLAQQNSVCNQDRLRRGCQCVCVSPQPSIGQPL